MTLAREPVGHKAASTTWQNQKQTVDETVQVFRRKQKEDTEVTVPARQERNSFKDGRPLNTSVWGGGGQGVQTLHTSALPGGPVEIQIAGCYRKTFCRQGLGVKLKDVLFQVLKDNAAGLWTATVITTAIGQGRSNPKDVGKAEGIRRSLGQNAGGRSWVSRKTVK